MTLLIVDDEWIIVQGLQQQLQGAIPEVDRIVTAYSAEQAKKVYARGPVDLLVTDVAMPRESGLELVKWVNENGYRSVNILLTGHEDFEYAKTAIRLQCFRYLLKPVRIDELKEALADAVKEKVQSGPSGIAQELKLDSLWRSLLTGDTAPDEASLHAQMKALQIDESLSRQDYSAALLCVHSRQPGYVDITEQVHVRDLKNALDAVSEHGYQVISMQPGQYALILNTTVSKICTMNEEAEILVNISAMLEKKWPQFRFVFYLFGPVSITSVCYAYELLNEYASSVLTSRSAVIPISDLSSESVMQSARPGSTSLPLRKWADWLRRDRPDDILMELRIFLHGDGSMFSVRKLTYTYYTLLNMIFSVFSDAELAPAEVLTGITDYRSIEQATASPEALLRWADRALHHTAEALQAGTPANTLIQEIRNYIRTHLAEPELDRNAVAEAVHITPDYLSYLFHKETGQVLSSYITRERIEEAAQLLRTTGYSLQDIAVNVGFSNVTYFSKQFKKITGQTPGAYRDVRRQRGLA